MLGLVLLAIAMEIPVAVAAQVRPGTIIINKASLQIPQGGGPDRSIASNEARITVVEQLDVALVRTGTDPITVTDAGATIPVLLTNRGNGQESFTVVATPADASVVVSLIAIDTDGDGRFDPAHDTVLPAGDTPSIAPGGTAALLVVLAHTRSAVTAASLAIVATATTGSGAPGTVFAGKGDNGADAVTGLTGASAELAVPFANVEPAAPTLLKTQVIAAPDGSATPVRGAIVTYSLAARFSGPTAGARIHDVIPAGTVYVPGSLRLDAAALTDPADVDAGAFDGTAIDVALGDIAIAATRTIQFQVKIQ